MPRGRWKLLRQGSSELLPRARRPAVTISRSSLDAGCILAGMADDRRATLRRRLAQIRARLSRPCSGELFDALLIEGATCHAELAEADRRHSQRARQPWQPAPRAKMRAKRSRGFWRGVRPAGYSSDPGRR